LESIQQQLEPTSAKGKKGAAKKKPGKKDKGKKSRSGTAAVKPAPGESLPEALLQDFNQMAVMELVLKVLLSYLEHLFTFSRPNSV
jgi:hypothetical protein